jgi:glutamyl-tRNA synthetase
MTPTTRFAPSPTGYLHIGSVRTALYAWLYARRHGGRFVLRIEDTDRERSTQPAIDAILDSMKWLALDPDEPPTYQTQRFDRYREVLDRLLADGKAYHCYCTREELDAMRADMQARGEKPRYDGRCRVGLDDSTIAEKRASGLSPVVRFRSPQEGHVTIDDQVKGRVVFDNAELDDLIIARSDGTPTYNFVVVVDDADMGITHVIRGDDHMNNTPRQVNLFHALGVEPPVFAHLPMIHGPDGAKLSKRHGAVNILEYRDMGYLPDAVLNYLLRLGWSHGDQEIFTREQMIELFDLEHVSRSASMFDPQKFLWVNQQHIQNAAAEELAPLLSEQLTNQGLDPANGPPLELTVEALRARSQTLLEMAERAHCYYEEYEAFDEKSAHAHLKPTARPVLEALAIALRDTPEWTEAALEPVVQEVAESLDLKLGKVAQPLRVALTGQAASPGIGMTLVLVGRERALARIARAITFTTERAAMAAGNVT